MLVKAFLTRKDNPLLVVPCLFNPAEFTVEKSNQFAEVNIPGLSSPIYQFVRGNARSVTLELFFDTYEEKIDVRIFTDRITGWDAGSMFSGLPNAAKGLMDIDSDLHAPPICLFVWGTFIFQCIIERVSKNFTMFLPEGIPARATLNVTLKEYREVDVQVKELDLHSADLTKSWVVKQGDNLWSIAAKEYGDPAQWRLIADANRIDNPRLLEPGRELVIPVKE
ncbi:MAG: LysM peptidoglycan-binding domain-containing protein [Candidatus Aminicenantes bacterium]|nr:LysM peptidoglycan-binding domain-containing protein [Candidatus Aminicenantes bacterium]NIM80168.1 LysM peptidoglycan-binding domain-containing protein [Candidatus Aminicenantes bacterium]NIN19504.1 LysM peptidoglycan-binding domain-containing protein [Candidatus Aminicenantes bacterium]NIN43403.1 LysM peptidoglycan-binding domain-containing protein [Candidatus Aminicenantes bacterium]NIN86148.1 LysM peptidoglycan-binding domain-containing protein [Candidatus Aminicenantes bacterium]